MGGGKLSQPMMRLAGRWLAGNDRLSAGKTHRGPDKQTHTSVALTMKTPQYLLGLFSLAWLMQPAAAFEFSGPFPERDYPFPVKESRIEVQVDEATVVEWIDNEKVIFSALKPGEPRLQTRLYNADRQDHFAPGRVVVWNTRTDEIKDLGEGKLYCAYHGYVSYYWKVPNPTTGKPESWFKKGTYGQEIVTPGYRTGDPPGHRDKFTCETFDGPRTASAPEYWTYQLRVQDGVLARTLKEKSNPEDNPVIWVRPDGSRLPLDMRWPEMQGAWWEDWAGVYVLRQLVNQSPQAVLPVLHPDGTVQRLSLPPDFSAVLSSRLAALTKIGIVLTNDFVWEGALFPNKATSGIYLARDGKVVRLAAWLVGNDRASFDNTHRGLAVSPDGCKIAFKHATGERLKARHTIKMIDLCQGK